MSPRATLGFCPYVCGISLSKPRYISTTTGLTLRPYNVSCTWPTWTLALLLALLVSRCCVHVTFCLALKAPTARHLPRIPRPDYSKLLSRPATLLLAFSVIDSLVQWPFSKHGIHFGHCSLHSSLLIHSWVTLRSCILWNPLLRCRSLCPTFDPVSLAQLVRSQVVSLHEVALLSQGDPLVQTYCSATCVVEIRLSQTPQWLLL